VASAAVAIGLGAAAGLRRRGTGPTIPLSLALQMNPSPQTIAPRRFEEILSRFGGLRLVVIGDCMLDRYIWGAVERISPEAPVPIVRSKRESVRLGGAANVAANLVALGARAQIFGVVGDDSAAREFRAALRDRGIDDGHVQSDASRPTTVKERVIAQSQQVVRIDRESGAEIAPDLVERIAAAAEAALKDADGVILSDYAKGVVIPPLSGRIIAAARRADRFLSVDPKVSHFRSYVGASLVTPNQAEAGEAFGARITDEASLVRAGNGILEMLDARAVLITRGEQGMSLFEKGGSVTHLPTVAREVFDVTGAGDTVISSFMMARGAGATLLEAAVVSNHAAGVVIREVGATTLTLEELRAAALGAGR
jgi:rfaE bifunctional protein kinase chain/domain